MSFNERADKKRKFYLVSKSELYRGDKFKIYKFPSQTHNFKLLKQAILDIEHKWTLHQSLKVKKIELGSAFTSKVKKNKLQKVHLTVDWTLKCYQI